MRSRCGLACVAGALLLPAVTLGAGVVREGSGGPTAWIDAPRSGSVFQAGDAVEIVAHFADPGGTGRAVVTVDGVAVATVSGDDRRTLDTVRVKWTADGSGPRLVGVRPEGGTGSNVDIVVVAGSAPVTSTTSTLPPPTTTVPNAPSTTSTTTAPSTTATPTSAAPTTAQATTTPVCVPDLVSLASPADGAAVTSAATLLSWGYSGCGPVEFEIVVAGDPRFGAVAATATVASTSWTTPSLTPCFTYWWRVRAVGNGGAGAWSSTASYTVLGRSC